MVTSKQFRQRAWDSLKGKYVGAFFACLIVGIIYSLGSFFTNFSQQLNEVLSLVKPEDMDSVMKIGSMVITGISIIAFVIGTLINIFIGNVSMVGGCNYFIKNTYSKPRISDVFSGYRNKYGRNVKAILVMVLKLFLWTMLLVVPGIIKFYEYALVPYIIAEDNQISIKDAFKKSKQLMSGNKWRLFVLNLSFYGWYILCAVIGIALAFVNQNLSVAVTALMSVALSPYVEAANAEFYIELKK